MYFLNFLCRNAIVNGKLNNLTKELNMHNSDYNTCVSVFFIGSVYLTVLMYRFQDNKTDLVGCEDTCLVRFRQTF